jgi:hypothetical protein
MESLYFEKFPNERATIMPSITQNTDFQRFSLPLLEALDLHCFWARFYDQPKYGYSHHHFSDDTLCCFLQGEGWVRLSGREKVFWQAPCLLLFRRTQAYDAFSPGPIQAHSMHFRCELAGKPPVSLLDLLDVPPLLPADLTAVIAPHQGPMRHRRNVKIRESLLTCANLDLTTRQEQ